MTSSFGRAAIFTSLLLVAAEPTSSLAAGGDVTFGPATLLQTTAGIADLVTVDMDNDGDLDIVTLEARFGVESAGFMNVFLNDGDGAFVPSQTLDLGDFFGLELFVNDLAAGDLDGDGHIDFAFIGTLAPLTIVLNNGDGTLASPAPTMQFVDIGLLLAILDIGDLDGDNDLDIAFGHPGQVALNDGTGGFETSVDVTADSNALQINVVELNGDGISDIAYGFRTHINDGNAGFVQGGDIPAAVAARSCQFGDFDGDGDQDVACAVDLAGELRIALNRGDATFDPTVTFPMAFDPKRLRTANLNGDEFPDLIATHRPLSSEPTQSFSVLAGNGDGSFADPQLFNGTPGETIGTGDFNGDGLDDVVIGVGTSFSSGGINILLNTTPILIGDLDGNGFVDIVDMFAMFAAWGPCSGQCPADLDGDDHVGITDFFILLANFS